MATSTPIEPPPLLAPTVDVPELLPARPLDLRRAVRIGLVGGITAVFLAAVGMVENFQDRELLQDLALGTALLLAVPFVFGLTAGRPPEQLQGFAAPRPGARTVAAGLITGTLAGLVMVGFVALIINFDVQETFVNIRPALAEDEAGPRLLLYGRDLSAGLALVMVVNIAAAMLASGVHMVALADERWRRAVLAAVVAVASAGLLEPFVGQVLRGVRSELRVETEPLGDFLYEGGALRPAAAVIVAAVTFGLYAWWRRPERQRRRTAPGQPPRPSLAQRLAPPTSASVGGTLAWALAALVTVALGLAVIWVIPRILGPGLSEALALAGIFAVMAIGLNVVVGLAGLLDLGYVAFFAVGAYTTAALTSDHEGFELGWAVVAAVPFVLLASAMAGLMVGTPVLRMRGDYLAIVTLGFGEIARILFVSDWLEPYFGGAQGITRIPDITLGPIDIQGSQDILYVLFVLILLAAYVSTSLQRSRIGRAWMAMREDEAVAEAVGVNIITAKLSAFVVGAVLAGLGGALFATKVGSVFSNSFDIVVSITVLVVVIVGGMASVPGVLVGALVLVGLPELLREFEEYRFLIYGALLIFMMLRRPEGFIPSKRRAQELHEDDLAQDSWLRREAASTAAPPAAPAGSPGSAGNGGDGGAT